MIPRIDYPYIQKVVINPDIPTWRKAELIKQFDDEKRDMEARGTDRSLPRWYPVDLDRLEAEIESQS